MLDLNKEISDLRQLPIFGSYLGTALQRLQDGINGLGDNVGADPTQTLPPPPKIQQLNVKTDGAGTAHATITDNNPIQKGIHYFMEMDTTPAFQQPHVFHMGTSRSVPPFVLPAKDDSGNPQSWYFRAYSSYPGGHPGEPVHFGGTTPTAVNPGGAVKLTLLPSTGSGTAPPDGKVGASGFGKVLYRPPLAPKRQS
jgi:hypothetical protein